MPTFLSNSLIILSAISWMLVYVLAIMRGFIDKTYAVPLPAVIANLVWELLYGTVFRDQSPAGPYIPLIWLLLDIVIFIQVLYAWQVEFPSIDKSIFILLVTAGFATCIGILYYAESEGFEYFRTAFPQNLMMSVLFVQMLLERKDVRGQSIYIAVFKLLGTASVIAVELFPIADSSKLDASVCFGILSFDIVYVVLLYQKLRRLGIHPLGRL